MESCPSCPSSLTEDAQPLYVQPHYRESYRLAIYALLCGGREAYEEYLQAEQLSRFLSEDEILFILENAETPVEEEDSRNSQVSAEGSPSTYFPAESDEEVPDLDLGWPEAGSEARDTSISLLFNPPRNNTPTIKEVVRRQIQEARQLIAIVMDVFTDVDIFKEIVGAALRGIAVYILLDDSKVNSFLRMSQSVSVNIQDIKNLRVRTVQGKQYQCRSGVKFHGGLEQKFLLVDCRTVLYGTYSYSWSFEKINLSMVLVVTGQLVCSFDEEFRRLYGRSVCPVVLSGTKPSVPYVRGMQNSNSSQFPLHQLHTRSRTMHGMRSVQNAAMLSRGVSVQERLNQFPDGGNLVRGHSYGGELQKVNSMSRLRMGTKDFGIPETSGSNLRSTRQQLRHQTRYGADHNLIPFNSEMSLHRWKMDAYLQEGNLAPGESYDGTSPVISPRSSHTGLNELQLIHSRSRDIKARMEEIRQKRLSLQDMSNFRQSQESLRSVYSTVERQKNLNPIRGLDFRQSAADLMLNTHNMDEGKLKFEEQILTDGHRSVSQYDIKTAADRRSMKTNNWFDSVLSRTKSDADLDGKLTEELLKPSLLHPGGLVKQSSRIMESLMEIPEEKEASNPHVSRDNREEFSKEGKSLNGEHFTSRKVAEPQKPDPIRGGHVPLLNGEDHTPTHQGKTLTETTPKIVNPCFPGEIKSPHSEKVQSEPEPEWKNSLGMMVPSGSTADEKKSLSLQRKSSVRSTSKAEHQTSTMDRTPKKGHSPRIARSQNSLSGQSEAEKHKPSSSKLSPQRLSRKKTNADEVSAVSQAARDRVYSRYELLFTPENASDKDRSTSLKRINGGYSSYPTQTGSDNKLGRFMQRVGNLINKNK